MTEGVCNAIMELRYTLAIGAWNDRGWRLDQVLEVFVQDFDRGGLRVVETCEAIKFAHAALNVDLGFGVLGAGEVVREGFQRLKTTIEWAGVDEVHGWVQCLEMFSQLSSLLDTI